MSLVEGNVMTQNLMHTQDEQLLLVGFYFRYFNKLPSKIELTYLVNLVRKFYLKIIKSIHKESETVS